MPDTPVPQHCPSPRELDDLELLVTGALAPVTGFDEPGSPITLALPDDVRASAEAAGEVELVDPEGLPLARVAVPGGTVKPLARPEHGPFRRLYLPLDEVRARYSGRTFVPVDDALTNADIAKLRGLGPIVLLALVGAGNPALSPAATLHATVEAARLIDDAEVVAVPVAWHDHMVNLQVVENYAAGDPVVSPRSDLPEHSAEAVTRPPAVAAIVERDQPRRDRRGLVLFFTGLSGSGKSTLARALHDVLLEQGERTVTSLDGDVVRRNLSAGLTFSKEDRETNIRRIGWVAAEISRHGGVAICSPIAPFDTTRKQVRAMVDEAGGAFVLVHVATPLEECERRDRKGLYARARAGEIPEFTGISSPYEEPEDAAVRVDTTGRTIEACLAEVLDHLYDAGYLHPVETTDPRGNPG